MAKVYVHAELKIRIGGYDRFCEAMSRQVPILEGQGWKLLHAFVTVLGRVYKVIHVWELPEANAFFDVTGAWRGSDEARPFRDVGAEVIEEEMITMVLKTPYSP
jgi:hypothetical protein